MGFCLSGILSSGFLSVGMEFGVMIHDMTYVVVAIIWEMTHVYQINLNLVKSLSPQLA